MTHTTVVTQIKRQIATQGYASVFIVAPSEDLQVSAKVFSIDADGNIDGKAYSGSEFWVNLSSVTQLTLS